ncbi:hypothetical protein E5161_12740 [Cohnella pontilimi]|uniref:Uncharacterized protein n=1 Tax=Cohnella pontilimi TaxID=2564100 RepID=A0A4U0FDF1_9BACL|nr:hypothetical protein [Cohnella pontilimi]TJY41292.1 hypothetical protein E5161_12740 [Cohnella pontilimi]
MKPLSMFLVMFVSLTACKTEQPELPKLESITLAEAYPGDILEVDKIELLDGSSGERKVVTDRAKIQSWLREIKDIVLTPDDNQEGRVGYLFGIELFEGEESKFGFIPNAVNGVNYEWNDKLELKIKALFEEQFGRTF